MNRRPRAVLVLSLAAALAAPLVRAAPPAAAMPPRLPPLRDQDRIRQEWLKARLERVLPALMRGHGVAMWIVACREYNEDPAFFSLVSPSVMAARRRTILVFHDRGLEEGVERLTLGGGSSGGLYKVYRDPDAQGRELMGAAQWGRGGGTVIERGDHLHTDFGIYAMGLATDTQHVGYVLRSGEGDAPAGLRQALLHSNQLQDLLLARLKPGRSGNEVFADTVAAMKAAGLDGTVYTHPIGDHGHGAGPVIGLWDRQEAIPGRGDVLVLPSTWFSIELQATTPVAEWGGQAVRSAQEEDVAMDADGNASWVLARQEKYHLVR